MHIHREFSYESSDERILKIGPYLPKLLSNIKWLTFLRHGVFTNLYSFMTLRNDVVFACSCAGALEMFTAKKRSLYASRPGW